MMLRLMPNRPEILINVEGHPLEKILESLTEISVAVVLFGLNDELIFCNEKYKSINEDIRQELTPGTQFSDLCESVKNRREISGMTGDRYVEERFRRFRKPGLPFDEKHADGHWYSVEDHRASDGYFVGIQTDITEQMLAQQALRESEERHRALSDLTSEGVSIHEDGVILEANQAFADMYGYSISELIGMAVLDLTTPEYRHDVAGRMTRNKTDTYESVSFRKDGSQIPVEIRAKKIVYKGRQMRVSRIRDLTETKRASQELERRGASLAEAQRIGNMGNWERDFVTGTFHWSDQIYRIFGLDTDEQPSPDNDRFLSIVHEDDRSIVRAAARAAARYSIDYRIVRPDGEERVVHEEAEIIRDTAGRRLRLAGTVQDITERKRSEQALIASEARFSGVLDIASDAIIMTDEDGNVQMFNQGARDTFGYQEDEVLGRSVDMLMPEEFRDGHARNMAGFSASGIQSRRMSERDGIAGLRKDGSKFPAEASVSRLEIGDNILFNVILRDVSDRKRIEREITQAKELAEAANSAKSQFLAGMSHELRTPLNAIIGFSEIMAGESFGPLGSKQYKEYATDIHNSGTLLLDLISDVLDLSKIEAGAMELTEGVVSLNETLRSTLRLVHERAETNSLHIATNLDPASPLIRGDERAIKQILLNLLSNSTKFTGEGGTITVSSQTESDGGVSLTVADTGIGIAPSDLAKVLEPFAQVGSAQIRAHQGTGLGLPIAKRLTEMHDATFELESEVGVGTTVKLGFPKERRLGPEDS